MKFPAGFRVNTLEERSEFYRRHFRQRCAWVWVRRFYENPVFAVMLGRKTGLYCRRFGERARKAVVFISSISDWREMGERFARYCPEGVYYFRTRVFSYEKCKVCPHRRDPKYCFSCENFDGQQLVFDIDPENLAGKLDMTYTSFSLEGFRMALRSARDGYFLLRDMFGKVVVVFSGRGFHLHVFDEDAFYMSVDERLDLSRRIAGSEVAVAKGKASLIRLPFSLNAVVGKIVTPVTIKEIEKFNPLEYSFYSSSSSNPSSSSSHSSSSTSSPS